MDIEEIKSELLKLSLLDRQRVIAEVQYTDIESSQVNRCQESRRELLNNKQGVCPHCGNKNMLSLVLKANHNVISRLNALK